MVPPQYINGNHIMNNFEHVELQRTHIMAFLILAHNMLHLQQSVESFCYAFICDDFKKFTYEINGCLMRKYNQFCYSLFKQKGLHTFWIEKKFCTQLQSEFSFEIISLNTNLTIDNAKKKPNVTNWLFSFSLQLYEKIIIPLSFVNGTRCLSIFR